MNEKEWDDMNPRELTILPRWFWGTVIVVVALFLYFAPRIAWAEEKFDRAGHIKLWTEDIRGHAEKQGRKFDWIIEDSGDEFQGGPVVKVTIPGKHWCLVAIDPTNPTMSAILGCAPIEKQRGEQDA